MKNAKQPHPRLTDLRLRKEIATLLGQSAKCHGFEQSYLELSDGLWALLKQREPVIVNGKELKPLELKDDEVAFGLAKSEDKPKEVE